jgi:putative transposase
LTSTRRASTVFAHATHRPFGRRRRIEKGSLLIIDGDSTIDIFEVMPRPPRKVVADGYYHVLNRGNGRMTLFHKHEDFTAFLNVLREGLEQYPADLFCYCLMGNHWHLVLRPRTSESLADLMRWVGVTHVRRHHQHYHSRGGGHLYQGRFKSFPIQDDRHFLTVCRYVEANPLRAKLVSRAEDWEYSSLRWWPGVGMERPAGERPFPLAAWPVDRPRNWRGAVNERLSEKKLAEVRMSVNRGRPFGEADWIARTAKRLGLGNTLRPAGRPKKVPQRDAGDQFGAKSCLSRPPSQSRRWLTADMGRCRVDHPTFGVFRGGECGQRAIAETGILHQFC